ncbi:hypothetical protein Tco_1536191 [Tanacetum coccineum]
MAELVTLQICLELDDTWAWVASGPKRQPDAAVGILEAIEDVHVADKGAPAIPAPVLAKVEEDVHEIRGALGEQREILDSMARDFS